MRPPQLWNFRARHNLTGTDLAEMLGVHKSQVSRWETGKRKIPLWLERFIACLDSTLPAKASANARPTSYDSGAESK